jgi:YhcH/YjgK/YiaL family protein
MIVDKIENSNRYSCLNKRFAKAFTFLTKTDLLIIADGKYEIEGDTIFALIQEYHSRDVQVCKLEAHRKYADIQYLVSGEELIGVAPLLDQNPEEEYNEKKDIIFFEGESSLIKLEAGMFAIFFPDDLHMPGVRVDQTVRVKKVVIKVRV